MVVIAILEIVVVLLALFVSKNRIDAIGLILIAFMTISFAYGTVLAVIATKAGQPADLDQMVWALIGTFANGMLGAACIGLVTKFEKR